VIGFLGFHYRLQTVDKFLEGVEEKSENEKIILLDSTGLIVKPDASTVSERANIYRDLQPFKKALSGEEWSGEFKDPIDGEDSIGVFVPITLNNGSKTWVVVSSQRKAVAFAPVRRNQIHLAVTTLLLFMATAIGSVAIIKSNRRIDRLNDELDKNVKDLELRVSARTEELITIINASPNFIFYKDRHDNIVRINEPAAKSIGKTPKEVEGRPSKEFYPDEADEYRIADLQVMSSGKPLLNIVEMYTIGTGEKRWVRTDKIPYRDEFGNIIGVIVFALDITDMKRHEEELKLLAVREHKARLEAERLGLIKDEFLITLSHELRTPLVPILGWLELIETSSMSNEDLKSALAIIERNARAELALVEELLDSSRVISGKLLIDLVPLNILDLVASSVESSRLAAEAKKIDLKIEAVGNPGVVSGDPKRLSQVFWNLLSNSIKFTPPNGKITVRVSSADTHAIIEVIDNGVGIDPKFLPYIFDRFHQADSSTTRRFGGLGLGLALARHLVGAHSGTLEADSAGKGLGSKFTVKIPLHVLNESEVVPSHPKNGEPNFKREAPAPDKMLAELRILVVDDNADDRLLMHSFLSNQGASVVTAASAQEGLDLIKSCQLDLLLSDIGMPGEDGYSFIRKVRHMTTPTHSIPAIALTAYGHPEDKLKASDAGYNMHLTKPINALKLAQSIRQLVTR